MNPGDLATVDTSIFFSDAGAAIYSLDDMRLLGQLNHGTLSIVLSSEKHWWHGRWFLLIVVASGCVGWVMERKLTAVQVVVDPCIV